MSHGVAECDVFGMGKEDKTDKVRDEGKTPVSRRSYYISS